MSSRRAIKIFRSLFPYLFVLFFLTAAFAQAQTTGNINVNLPNVPPAKDNPGAWVGGFYKFSLMIAGLLAFGMIVYAGLKYTFAAGNPSTQSDARDQILQALLGVLLLLGAYIVLITINPNLINLQLPGLRKIEGRPQITLQGASQENLNTVISSGTPGKIPPSALSQTDVQKEFDSLGIGYKQTKLSGLQPELIDTLGGIKKNCNCEIKVNSGTGDAHKDDKLYNHYNGFKADLKPNDQLNAYIVNKNNSTYIGPRSDDKAPQYLLPNGYVAAWEGSHWDIGRQNPRS